eukprot:3106209-Prorocentrum_lima.AAC.1
MITEVQGNARVPFKMLREISRKRLWTFSPAFCHILYVTWSSPGVESLENRERTVLKTESSKTKD